MKSILLNRSGLFALVWVLYTIVPSLADAAVRTWTNASGDGRWSTSQNWSDNTLPGQDDTALFDGTSSANVVIDLPVGSPVGSIQQVGAIQIESSYTGTLTQTADLEILSRFSQSGGVFTQSGSPSLVITQTFYSTLSEVALIVNGGEFNGGAGTIDVLGDVRITGGRFVAPSGTLSFGASWVHSGGTFEHNMGTVIWTGTQSANYDSSLEDIFYNLTINRSNYINLFSNTLTVEGMISLQGGSFTGGAASRIVVQGDWDITPPSGGSLGFGLSDVQFVIEDPISAMFSGREIELLPELQLSKPLIINAPLSVVRTPEAGLLPARPLSVVLEDGRLHLGDGLVTFENYTQHGGEFDLGVGSLSVTGVFLIDGGAVNASTATELVLNDVYLSGGSFAAPTSTMTVEGSWIQGAGRFDANLGTVSFSRDTCGVKGIDLLGGELPLYGVQFNVAGVCGYSIDNGVLQVSGPLALESGTLLGSIDAFQDVSIAETFVSNGAELRFVGSMQQHLSTAVVRASAQSGPLTVDKTGGALILDSDLASASDVDVKRGMLDFNGKTVSLARLRVEAPGVVQLIGSENIMGSVVLESGSTVTYTGSDAYTMKNWTYANLTIAGTGTFTQASSLDVNGNLDIRTGIFDSAGYDLFVAGNWSNAGEYQSSGNTVILDGGDQTISGNTTFSSLVKTPTTASVLNFGVRPIVISGEARLYGASVDARLALRASEGIASVDFQGSREFRYLDVQNNHNTNASPAMCFTGCVDAAGNQNWIFAPSVAFGVASGTGVEVTQAYLQIPVVLDYTSDDMVTLQYSVSGTAVSPSDYTLPIAGNEIVFSPGETSTVIYVYLKDDFVHEQDETIVVTLRDPTGARLGAISTYTYTIQDNDALPTVAFTKPTSSVNENSSQATMQVVLSETVDQDVVVTYSVTGISAVSGEDFTVNASPITIPAGGQLTTISVGILNDLIDEDPETFKVTLTSATGADLGDLRENVVTINDNDNPPTVYFSDVFSGDEATLAPSMTLVLSAPSNKDITVSYAVTGGSAIQDVDYQFDTTTVVFPAGTTTAQILFTLIDDAIDEDDIEKIDVTLTGATNAMVDLNPSLNPSVYSILDNDVSAVLVTANGGTHVTEGSATDNYTVVLQSEPMGDVVVDLSADSQVSVSVPSLTFTQTTWNIPQTVSVTALDDNLAQGSRAVEIAHSVNQEATQDVRYQQVSVLPVSVDITDNDTPGVSVIETDGSTRVTEGDPVGDRYTVVLTTEPSAEVTIRVSHNDQVLSDASTLTFTADTWNVPQTVVVTAADDLLAEGEHHATMSYTVSSADTGYDGLLVSDRDVVITDNDQAGVLISADALRVSEAGETASYTVRLTSRPTADVELSITTDAQVRVSAETLIFTPSTWMTEQTVTVSAVDDTDVEIELMSTLTHRVERSDDLAYAALPVSPASVQVIDNDEEVPPTDPETPPTDPETPPTDPETPPTDPETPPTDPETPPTDPETPPTNPETPPTDPTDPTPSTALPRVIVGLQAGQYVYEEQIDGRIRLIFPGDKVVMLPVGADDAYTFVTTESNRLVLGSSSLDQGRGRLYLAQVPMNELPALTDLSTLVVNQVAKSASEVASGLTVPGPTPSVDAQTFAVIAGAEAGDQLGAYLALLPASDGVRVLASSPFAGTHGLLQAYQESGRMTGAVLGSSDYPVRSVLVGDVAGDSGLEVVFGPANRTINETLYRESDLADSVRMLTPFALHADAFDRVIQMSTQLPEMIFASDALVDTIALGDLNHDGKQDLVRVLKDGRVTLSFGNSLAAPHTVDVQLVGGKAASGFGRALQVGDFNGDGISDLAIGVPAGGTNTNGAVYIVAGRTTWPSSIDMTVSANVVIRLGTSSNDELGNDAIALDVNADGIDDLLATKSVRRTEELVSAQVPAIPAGGEDPADAPLPPVTGDDGLGGNLKGSKACTLVTDLSQSSLSASTQAMIVLLIAVGLAGLLVARRRVSL